MMAISGEDQGKLEAAVKETARILRKYSDTEKLKTFESIEVEVREQMQRVVAPRIAEFFFQKEGNMKAEEKER